MLGFIEELVVNDDPEHQWIEKIRTPRASNEARQRLFSKLSGTIQRKLGVKVLEMGGNAVLGYFQNFDLEGESGIVVRAVGTAVSLVRLQIGQASPAVLSASVSPGKEVRRHSLSLHSSIQHIPHHHHRHPHHKQQHHHHQDESTHQPHSAGSGHSVKSAVRSIRQGWRPRPTSVIEISRVGSRSHGFSPPNQGNRFEFCGGGGSSGGSSSDMGWFYSGASPPPTAPPVMHGFHQRNQPNASSTSPSSVFHFPSTSAAFPEGSSAMSPVGSGNVLTSMGSIPTSTTQQQKSPLGSPDAVGPPGESVMTTPGVAPTSGPGDVQTATQQQQETPTLGGRHSISPNRVTPEPEGRIRRSSESEVNSPPRVGTMSGVGTPSNLNVAPKINLTKNTMFQQSIDLLEYPFFTMRTFPPGFIINLGGVVSARSVKLLDKIHNPEEPQTRDAWWSELRVEIKSHALKLGCHAVLGYSENTTICDEVIILSAAGTAAKINLEDETSGPAGGAGATSASSTSPVSGSGTSGGGPQAQSVERSTPGTGSGGIGSGVGKDKHLFVDIGLANQALHKSLVSVDGQDDVPATNCTLCHIPYCPSNLPFEIQLSKCAMCRICRGRSNKNKSSEQSAREVSDILPFIEYEVHNQLINKLKLRGLNSLFGLKIHVVLGDNMIIAIGVATAHDSQDLITLQKRINRTVQMHRERLNSEIVVSATGMLV
ncbi:C2 domain-containing protein 5 [Elysia marginata]|uniref:C2 domain-containing protein 5 n=1 Tax=Elysia marginata TaxID=1093978 RepID=A0AAV4JRD1_9GAST|nr:C2 domain-containing protein 5 [Elysia marginata]